MPTLSTEEKREKSGKILEVFDDVRAFLSDQVLRSIPDGIETFFQENGVPGKLQEDVSTTCLRYLIQGSFLDILTAREILQKHVLQQDAIGPCQISDAEEVTLSIAFQDGIQDPCGDDVASHEVIRTNDADDSTELPVKEEAFNLSSETTLLVNVVPNPNDCGEFCPTDLQHAFQEVTAVADDGVLEQVEQSDSSSVPLPDPMVIEIHCSKLEDAMLDLPVGISTTEDGTEPAADVHDAGKEAAQETVGQRRKRNYEQVTPFKYFCEMCSFKTKRNSHYIKHMKIHEKEEEGEEEEEEEEEEEGEGRGYGDADADGDANGDANGDADAAQAGNGPLRAAL
ncbi:zinc finger protein 16 isoform X2 [Ixodes scapularis]